MSIAQVPYSIAVNAREFLAGIAAEEASNNKNKEAAVKDINRFISQVDTDLRTVYDKFIPNVHVVDVVNFTNIVANRIVTTSNKFVDAGTASDIISNFADTSSKEYRGLYKVILDNVKKYHTYLLSKQGVMTNPIAELNTLSLRLFNRTRKIDNTISARILGVEFSNRIRSIFGSRSVLAAIDTGLGSSDTTFIFFTSSFNALSTPMKDNVYSEVEKYIKDLFGPDTVSNFALGTVVNAGHAVLVTEIGNYVNSPAFAQVLYGVARGRTNLLKSSETEKAAEIFKIESKITDNKITVNKDLIVGASGYKVLLALGVTFTNIEDADINADRGRRFEGPAVRKYKFTKPTSLSASSIKKLADSLYKLVLRENPALGTSSRSIVDFIRDAAVGQISGKPTKSESSKISSSIKVKSSTVTLVNNNSTKFPSTKVSTNRTVLSNKVAHIAKPISGLLALLNARLFEQIQKNMGTGNETKVLNFRSGRFAESARVERISQSRKGMVSAFYSYMRNPYGTFSEGGKQQYPRSRDPKALISKSIREIGATMVGNRMRAVLV